MKIGNKIVRIRKALIKNNFLATGRVSFNPHSNIRQITVNPNLDKQEFNHTLIHELCHVILEELARKQKIKDYSSNEDVVDELAYLLEDCFTVKKIK